MGLPALQAQSCQGHSLHCSFTASHGHAHVYRHIHTHTCTLARVCTDRRHMPRHSSSHGLHIHVCAHTHRGTRYTQLYTHSCPTYAGAHTCAHSTYACARACTSMDIHTRTLTEALTRVCTHSHVVPPPPALGEGPGNSSRRSTSGPLAEPWAPQG